MGGKVHMGQALKALPVDHLDCFRDVGGGRVAGFRERTGFEGKTTTFRAHVQPTTPQQMRFLRGAGGEEVDEAITIYTKQDLKVTDDKLGLEADRVDYRGKRYKIISAFDWSGQGFRTYIAGPVVT